MKQIIKDWLAVTCFTLAEVFDHLGHRFEEKPVETATTNGHRTEEPIDG